MTLYLSATSIKDFMDCSMKHYHRVHNRDRSQQTTAMLIGTVVHEVLEKGWQERNSALEMGTELCKVYNIPEEEWKIVHKHINSFFDYFRGLVGDNDIIETKFQFQWSEGVYIIGKIDRILEGSVGIDWKTSKTLPREIDRDPQFIIYNEAHKQMYGHYPSAFFYASLKTGKMIQHKPDPMFSNALFDTIIPKMVDMVRANQYAYEGLFKYNFPCQYCTYKEVCWEGLKDGMAS